MFKSDSLRINRMNYLGNTVQTAPVPKESHFTIVIDDVVPHSFINGSSVIVGRAALIESEFGIRELVDVLKLVYAFVPPRNGLKKLPRIINVDLIGVQDAPPIPPLRALDVMSQ